MNWVKENYRGISTALLIALAASYLGGLFPLVGASVFGILLGIFTGNVLGKPEGTVKGLSFTSKKVLQWAVIALGSGLSLTQIYEVGVNSLSVMFFTLSAAFITAFGFGRLMKIPLKLTSLIGVGTAICGGSAIAAISPVIEAEEKDISYAISTVFIFNVIAVLIFPPLGHLIGFSDNAFGLWAGTAINDTSSVVAAGYAYSSSAGDYATIVKLTRTTMIVPIALIFTAVMAVLKKRQSDETYGVKFSMKNIFPRFVLGFLAASVLRTIGVIGTEAASVITTGGRFMIVLALSAIGLNSDFRKMVKTGFKPILLGFAVWFAVTVVSLIVQFAGGQY